MPLFLTLTFCLGVSVSSGNLPCETLIIGTPFISDASCQASARPVSDEWLRHREKRWRLLGFSCGPLPDDEGQNL